MSAQVVVFNPLGTIPEDVEREVRAGIEDGLAAFSRHAPVRDVGIAVHPNGYTSEFTGLGGMNYGGDSFSMFVDTACDGLRVDTRRRSAAVAVHELHHAIRQRHLPSLRLLQSDSALCAGDVLALEGLAIHCEYFLGFGPSLNVHEASVEATLRLVRRVAPIVGDPQADWSWIYDLNGLPPPVYKAMYPMGFRIVADYLRQHGVDPIEAVGVPWRDIWAASKHAFIGLA